jgi:hypothetical protein
MNAHHLIFILSACAANVQRTENQQQIDAYDHARCLGYGLKPLDPEYGTCRHALKQMRNPGTPETSLAEITINGLARRSSAPDFGQRRSGE